MSETALFDPPVFRFTVRTPESRHAAIKARAERVGMTPQQLVQALFDCIDLSTAEGPVTVAHDHFHRLFPPHETTREPAERARSVGLTVRDLKVFRALASAAGLTRIVRPSPFDMSARTGVASGLLDEAYGRLLAKGFIREAPSQGRGRRAFQIARMPDL